MGDLEGCEATGLDTAVSDMTGTTFVCFLLDRVCARGVCSGEVLSNEGFVGETNVGV